MKNEPPLTDRDFAAVRHSVLATLEIRRTRRVRAVRVLSIVVAIVAMVAILQRPTRQQILAPRPVPVARAIDRPVAPQGAPLAARVTPLETHSAVAAASRPQPKRRERPGLQAPVPSDEPPMRLEIATANPDIRIIWISNSNNEPTGELQ